MKLRWNTSQAHCLSCSVYVVELVGGGGFLLNTLAWPTQGVQTLRLEIFLTTPDQNQPAPPNGPSAADDTQSAQAAQGSAHAPASSGAQPLPLLAPSPAMPAIADVSDNALVPVPPPRRALRVRESDPRDLTDAQVLDQCNLHL